MAFSSAQLPTSTMASSFAANATTEISAAAAFAATATATGDLLFNATLAPNDYGNFSGETSFLLSPLLFLFISRFLSQFVHPLVLYYGIVLIHVY